MSPEQVEGLRHVDARSDLFSFGLIAYEVLTGQLPYDVSGSPFAIQQALVEADFPAPSTTAAHVPPSLDDLVGRLLARDPADRPADAAAVVTEMEAVASSVPTSAEPDLTSSAAPDPPSLRLWSGLAAMVLLALVGIYFGVQSALEPSPSPSAAPAGPTPPDTLSVATSPDGATVIVDGESAGETPLALPVRAGGSVHVQLKKDGYVPRDTVLQVTGTARLAATLIPTAAGPSSPTGSTGDVPSRAAPDASPPSAAGAERGPSPTASTGQESAPRTISVLRIRTTPPGASVQLDGSVVGTSPLALSDLSPGTYRLAFQKEGYQAVERTLTVPPRGSTVVQETLPPAPAVVELRVRPSGTIAVDGEVRSRDSDRWLTDTLAAGTHELRLTSSLGRWTSTVTLEPGQTYRRSLDFSQTVDVAVTARTESGAPVPNATVYVDGTPVGYTPQRLSLRVGQHTLRVEKERFRASERILMVEPGMQSPVVVELSPRAQ
jgi:hypothetical protein